MTLRRVRFPVDRFNPVNDRRFGGPTNRVSVEDDNSTARISFEDEYLV